MMDTGGIQTGAAVVDTFTVDWTTSCGATIPLVLITSAPTIVFNHDYLGAT